MKYHRSPHSPAITDELNKSSQPLQKELSFVRKEIKVITDKIKEEDEAEAVEGDWKFSAMVIDCICLIVYTLFTMIATVVVLWTAPHFKSDLLFS